MFIQLIAPHPHSPADVREAWRAARDAWSREQNVAAELDGLVVEARSLSDPRILATQKKLIDAEEATAIAVEALFDSERAVRDAGRHTPSAA